MARTPNEPDLSTYVGQVASRIRARRVKSKMLAVEAAERAGVPVQTWYHWEQGYALPLDALPKIAKALGCKPRTLLPE
jgi:transcriptional regulator with XRE-family HTH domain